MRTIGIITRYAPATRAITATDAAALAAELARCAPGDRVILFCAGGRYDGAHAKEADGGAFGLVQLEAQDPPKTGLGRLMNSIGVGFRLAWASRACDVIVAQTDPPLLHLWVGTLSRLRRRPWADWTMDLYPEAFVASGLVGSRSLAVRGIHWLQSRVRPTMTIALGDGQANYLRSTGRAATRVEILPCGVPRATAGASRSAQEPRPAQRPVRATYAGNIGQAHDVDRVAAALFGFCDAGAEVSVAPSGAKADDLRVAVAARPEIQVRTSMSHAELAEVDFHVASLSHAWTHVCVPSKAVTAASLGAHVVFLGSAESDSARLAGQRCTILTPDLALDDIRLRCRQFAEAGRPAAPVDTSVPAQERYAAGLPVVARSILELAKA